jgi:hypothetical protein
MILSRFCHVVASASTSLNPVGEALPEPEEALMEC